MGKLAFVFAGQGAQAPGMGQTLYGTEEAARRVFDAAEAQWPGLLALCFEGGGDELGQTRNTQPCLYTVELAVAAALGSRGIRPSGVAGFSLGEVAALRFAGGFEEQTGFALVRQRAALMQQAAEEHPGAMSAVLRLADAEVEGLCERFENVYPVNYNCDGQLVVAGAKDEMDAFEAAVAESGGRARRLAVGGGFHSPFMAGAAKGFAAWLQNTAVQPLALPVYANLTGAPYDRDVREMLAAQMQSPVKWKQTISRMGADGYDTFIEIGPGKALAGFIKRILPSAAVYSVCEADSLAAVEQALQEKGDTGLC